MSTGISRRRFIGNVGAGAVLLGLGPTLLSACGDDDDSGDDTSTGGSGSGGGGDFGELGVQLSWIKNIEFAGLYIADSEGYFADEGFSSVNLIAGPGDAIAPLIQGQVLYSFLGSETWANAVLNDGAPIKIIGANFQENPFCILYLADNPLETPEDMVGKTIGVQTANEQIWQAFLRKNGLEEGSGAGQVNKVPVDFEPTPLENGEVDGFFSFITNEPNILRTKGLDVGTLNLQDNGITLYQQIYGVTEETLEGDRDKLVAAMRAESKGWQEAIANQELAIQLTLEEYGADLDLNPESQKLELEAQIELQQSDSTDENGLFYMSEEDIERNLSVLADLGLEVSADLYTNEILDEVYADGIDLRGS
ncbi:ABC transporter substrate-binding protein [Iamia sp. SCSIO 61187]|uniref:ABC transporter substrate-binding protein n=1 Tax=Iamia sp. SCSIO 61187 TaxID=2722752 RepID=UPI001C633F69|nr:ABC transporter substrate-binding protein [Iamia sp. SCSIO 61187]QYG93143.1 ABC transporter substrate-binding protein [Iamia sp. SCSIO 61187]